MSDLDEPYENTTHPKVLLLLNRAAKWPDDNVIGIQLQRKLGSAAIPYKSECEGGAGVWYRIRQGMLLPAASTGNSTRKTEGKE